MADGVCFEETIVDGEVHWLSRPDDFVARIICFPLSKCNVFNERLDSLISNGFIYFLETGWSFQGLRLIGKGYSGVVVLAKHARHGLGVLKLRRLDSRRESLRHEGLIMRLAHETGLAPRLFIEHDDYIFREYLPPWECVAFDEFVETSVSRGDLTVLNSLLKTLLARLNALDRAKIDHGELNRPGDHILVCRDRLVLIDWESARKSNAPRNVTSVFSHLVFRSPFKEVLLDYFKWSPAVVVEKLKHYKKTYDFNFIEELLSKEF
ncbi:serine/threonine protein kinase [Thermosphaera sp.]|uniref:Serine/threonine protein kinase n=1 Tax=Thermosphaera aggregans TaxID=54254 RepID=A0A7C2BLM4_9CREN